MRLQCHAGAVMFCQPGTIPETRLVTCGFDTSALPYVLESLGHSPDEMRDDFRVGLRGESVS
jgi:hypothetical protein